MKRKTIASVIVLSLILSLFAGISVSAAEVNYNSVKTEGISGETVIVNIDFTVLKGQTCDYALRFFDSGNAAGTPFGAVRFNKDGRVLIHSDARHWNQDWMGSADYYSTYEKANFEQGVTYNLKVRLDVENGLVDYFLDDEWIAKSTGTPGGSWWNITSVGENGMDSGFDWKVNSVVAAKRGEMGVELSEFDSEKIRVVFSETPTDGVDFSKTLLLNTNEAAGGSEAQITGYNKQGAIVEFSYKNVLQAGCEYAIVLPENIEGKLDGKLMNNYLYFTAPAENETEVKNYDFESEDNSFSVVQASGNFQNLSEKAQRGKDGSYGLVVKSGTLSGSEKNESVPMNWDGFEMSDEDYTVLSFDVKPLCSDLAVAMRFLTVDDNTKTPIMTGFTTNGKIVGGYVFDIYQILQGNDSWWNDRMVRGSYTKDEWVNIRIEWDNLSKKGYFYINGELASVKNNQYDPATAASAFTGIDRVRMYAYQNLMSDSTAGTELMILDNVKISVINKPLLVKQVRFNDINGNTVGAYNTTDRMLSSIDVYFNDEIDENTLSSALALKYDGEDVPCGIIYDSENNCATLNPKMLPGANARVEVSISGVKDAEGVRTVQPYIGAVTAENAEDEISAEKLKFVYGDGTNVDSIGAGEVYVGAVVANTTELPQDIIISAMGYKDSALSKFEYKTVTVAPGTIYEVSEKSEEPIILNINDTDKICLMVQNAEDGSPLSECVCIEGDADAEGDITISGSVPSNSTSVDAMIEVYAPGMSFENLNTAEDFRDVLIYKSQIKTEKDGSYNEKINIDYDDAVSGMYLVKVMADGYSDTQEMLYVNPEATAVALEKLNEALSDDNAEEAGKIIFDNHYALYIDDRYINEELANDAADILIEGNKNLTEVNAKEIINKAVGIAGVNAGVITDILGEAEMFDLDNSEIKDVYDADYVNEDTSDALVERMSDEDCKDIDEFYDVLTEQFVLSVVANPVRPGSVAAVLKLVGLTGYSSQAHTGVANEEYDTIADLKDALDSYKTSGTSSSRPNGGGGGGSSSGGGATGNYQVANDVTADDVQNNINNITNEVNDKIFTDLNGYEWAEEEIITLHDKGVVSGTGNGCFEPGRFVTREEFVKLLCESFNLGGGGTETSFADVSADSWYAPYVAKAVEIGMVKGISDSMFGSGMQISREDMAVIIYRALLAESHVIENDGMEFADKAEISDYAKEAVDKLSGAGVVNGKGDGMFAPKAAATRAEAAVIILRCIESFSL